MGWFKNLIKWNLNYKLNQFIVNLTLGLITLVIVAIIIIVKLRG